MKKESGETELNWEDYKKMEFTQCVSFENYYIILTLLKKRQSLVKKITKLCCFITIVNDIGYK